VHITGNVLYKATFTYLLTYLLTYVIGAFCQISYCIVLSTLCTGTASCLRHFWD